VERASPRDDANIEDLNAGLGLAEAVEAFGVSAPSALG
jgi:hypothetical protein